MDNNGNQQEKLGHDNDRGSAQGRSEFKTGSTTQGGSNYGQGSSQLGGGAYKQGSERSEGANYDNEAGKFGNVTEQPNNINAGQQGGGAGGYDADREQQEVNKEREDMNNERDLDELNVEQGQTPQQDDEQEQNPIKEIN